MKALRWIRMGLLAVLVGFLFGAGCMAGARAAGAVKLRDRTPQIAWLEAQVWEVQVALARLQEQEAGR